MYFEDVYRQLIDIARQRVHAGEVSERRLARLAGISQPHLHNVLKNIRTLSPSSADRLMRVLKLTVQELLWQGAGTAAAGVQPVPLLSNRIGPGTDANLDAHRGYYPVPLALLSGLVNPVAATISPDLVLPLPLQYNDVVLLDRSPARRATPNGTGCWVVAEPSGLRVRYVRLRGASVCVADESNLQNPPNWRALPASEGNILDIVRARIVWIGREMEKEPGGPSGPPGPGD